MKTKESIKVQRKKHTGTFQAGDIMQLRSFLTFQNKKFKVFSKERDRFDPYPKAF